MQFYVVMYVLLGFISRTEVDIAYLTVIIET